MPSNKVRTRFAPSPTGYMHVGNLRTALYTYLMAKHEDGTFILRIEDTDQGRYVEGAVDVIYNTLRETGLLWDEGPDIGGPVGPYVQSERMGMFKQYAEQLVAEGKAYYCFCTEERLEALHAEQRANGEMTHYDGCCRDLPEEEVKQRLAAGEPYVIRQKIPKEGVTGFDDVVYGHIEVENSEMDDQILIKTDGMPTYNFANVVDDHLMGITHVIRGSEYLSSTPKYNLLYQAFGWEIPTYIHCPPVMKDAQNKLSKRNGDASYQDLVAKGYLSEAVMNYICLLGWSPKGEYAEQEIFSLEELIKIWSPDGISKSPAIFDPLKLRAINAEYIRRLSPEEFQKKAEPWIDQAVHTPIDKKLLCANLQPRCEAQLTPFRTRHRVPSRGYRLDLPRAGRFDPAKARALNVPVPAWKLLQRGQSIPLENGAVVAPADVLGPARRGLRFVFSGDTAPCPALEQAAQNADLFLCDATYPDNEQEAQAKQWGHSTFAQGAAIAKKADVRRFWLMHYSPMILEPEAALPNAQAVFPAAECGFDGKQIILQYDEETT